MRLELNTGSDWPTTVTCSATTGWTSNARSVAVPRFTVTPSLVSAWNAVPLVVVGATITEYGPPTRMPGIKNRPSSRVMAW